MMKWRFLFLLPCLLTGISCKKSSPATVPPVAPAPSLPFATPPGNNETVEPAKTAPSPAAPSPPNLPTPSRPPQAGPIIAQIDGKFALQQSLALCHLGPRDYSSPGHGKVRALLTEQLKRSGWRVVEQSFETDTPAGKRTYTNLIGTHPSAKKSSPRVILAAHYDSPGSRVVTFPAASSGAAGCGVLLEIAQRLAFVPDWAAEVQLVFFDGEEPVQQSSATDGLSGSRFFIHTLVENQRIADLQALVVFGTIGHNDAHWTLPTMTPNGLSQSLRAFATEQKWDTQISDLTRPSWGAHLPALQAGIPAIYLNDALYALQATADDTPDHLAAESLRRATMAGVEIISETIRVAGKPK